MPCYHPNQAYKSDTLKTERGKAVVTFKPEALGSTPFQTIKLPCGQCIGCRIERSRQWATRCIHEASLYDKNCFITLTFNDDHLNKYGSLYKPDFQKFMKRLRKAFKGDRAVTNEQGKTTYPIRYFHCGEYGEDLDRPHHHACLFNFDFPDKELKTIRNGNKCYRSPALEELWPFGFSLIGEVTWQSAAYVARYVVKKINGDQAANHYVKLDESTGELFYIEPEYVTMSRRPGIGKDWYKKYQKDLYPKDFVTHNGKRFKVPSYYDRLYDVDFNEEMAIIKQKRSAAACKNKDDPEHHGIRLNVKEKCQQQRVKKLVRDIS